MILIRHDFDPKSETLNAPSEEALVTNIAKKGRAFIDGLLDVFDFGTSVFSPNA